MDTVGMDNLSSAAAQGEQASEPHHADGYIFTGTDPSVQTLEDAVRQEKSKQLLVPHSPTLVHDNRTVYDRSRTIFRIRAEVFQFSHRTKKMLPPCNTQSVGTFRPTIVQLYCVHSTVSVL